MTERGRALHATADQQLAGLIGLLSRLDEAALHLPCPGREKLGDGTVAACARHTVDNYQRIAAFVQNGSRMSWTRDATPHSGHRITWLRRAVRHGPANRGEHRPGARQHADSYSENNIDLNAVVTQLAATRDTLGHVADLTDRELDAIPPKDSFRFCDGQRTLEQVLVGLLKHQQHQVDALAAATR